MTDETRKLPWGATDKQPPRDTMRRIGERPPSMDDLLNRTGFTGDRADLNATVRHLEAVPREHSQYGAVRAHLRKLYH